MSLMKKDRARTLCQGLTMRRCVTRGTPFVLVLLFALASSASASMVLNTGTQIATHAGNLVTNGSFETGAPPPGLANQLYWATGTTNLPFSVPTGWTSSGQPQTYALWGSDSAGGGIEFSDTIPDGSSAMYFGNAFTGVSPFPTFNPDHSASFTSPPTFTPFYGGTCTLSQVIHTETAPAPSYALNFWVSGEDASFGGFSFAGVFGLKVSNVLPGDPIQYFEVPNTPGNPSYRLEFFFTPLNSSLPVNVEFINWGHWSITGTQPDATELALDDVIVNKVPEPATLALFGVGGLVLMRRRHARG